MTYIIPNNVHANYVLARCCSRYRLNIPLLARNVYYHDIYIYIQYSQNKLPNLLIYLKKKKFVIKKKHILYDDNIFCC